MNSDDNLHEIATTSAGSTAERADWAWHFWTEHLRDTPLANRDDAVAYVNAFLSIALHWTRAGCVSRDTAASIEIGRASWWEKVYI